MLAPIGSSKKKMIVYLIIICLMLLGTAFLLYQRHLALSPGSSSGMLSWVSEIANNKLQKIDQDLIIGVSQEDVQTIQAGVMPDFLEKSLDISLKNEVFEGSIFKELRETKIVDLEPGKVGNQNPFLAPQANKPTQK